MAHLPRRKRITALGLTLAWLVGLAPAAYASGDSLLVRGPSKHGHLSVYWIEAPDAPRHPYLTLDQALRAGRAVIHENNSQTLWIENRSDTDLFIQSAEIIKGGQQDRMIASDMIVPAHDTSLELRVYCVEKGRSTKRGSEPLETFSASPKLAPLNHLRHVAQNELTGKLLNPHLNGLTAPDPEQAKLFASLQSLPEFSRIDDAAQESIWKDVSQVQSGLTHTIKDSVTHNASPTSLELALESQSLSRELNRFERDLLALSAENAHTRGAIFAIDGQIIGGDLYGSHALFVELWPKLLHSAGTEYLLNEPHNANSAHAPSTDDILNYLDASDRGKMASQNVNDRTLTEVTESEACYKFATHDTKYPGTLHSAFLPR